MPYMTWHKVISIFGYNLLRCSQCGAIYISKGSRIRRIGKRSCSFHQ